MLILGGRLFEVGCLLNFHHFHIVVILFCNKTVNKNINCKDVPKQNLNMTLQLELSCRLSDSEVSFCKPVKEKYSTLF